MSKENFSIKRISKKAAEGILTPYHYLSGISKGFKSGDNLGLFNDDELVGVCIFTGFPVPELGQSIFGVGRSDQYGMYELSRLCLSPDIQKTEHNLASWFVSRCIKLLRKHTYVRAILSYADAAYHTGTVYKACNFKYYGLTDAKKDFWILNPDNTYTKHSRGPVKGLAGEWRDRTRKHRYLLVFDKTLSVKWKLGEVE